MAALGAVVLIGAVWFILVAGEGNPIKALFVLIGMIYRLIGMIYRALVDADSDNAPTTTRTPAKPPKPTDYKNLWRHDPTGRHQLRWVADGKPTAWVHDDGVTSFDPF